MKAFALALLVIAPIAAAAQQMQHEMQPKAPEVTLETGLGSVSHAVSTKNADAQRFFNQGLAYIFAFNHNEAIRSFRRAAELDPSLAMAYWGSSLALGSNYNLPADSPALKAAFADLQKAKTLAGSKETSSQDRDYVEALWHRYSANPNSEPQERAAAYREAMAALVKKYPNDLDAATLYAESMMNLHPWQLWTSDGQPTENTLELIAVLEGVLKRDPNHSGANHYYIHAVEASPNPERALPSAKRMGAIAPSAGHLVHMPAHVYIRTGDYASAASVNMDAIKADERFIKKNGSEGLYQAMYYNHNIHFLASASAMNGNYAEAIANSRKLGTNVLPMIKMMPMLEMFAAYPMTTLVRFHRWDEVLSEPAPGDDAVIMTAMWHFARGVALAETGKASDAERELADFRAAVGKLPATMPWGNNLAPDLLKVPEKLLTGEAALSAGDRTMAVHHFTRAVAAQDALVYNEPPDWDLPAREFLGRALLISGENAGAEDVYRAELKKHPNSGRAIYGLIESLKRQKKTREAARLSKSMKAAWKHSDTPVAATVGGLK